ncbi:serine/threonine-protein phosphatase [Bifidobacterium sp. ESL0790]|uniref:PP2C family protein-serine/threonine phosphatase n=1 Tax=Bifidobacterium sp. ESL0790 TaxID=2983233 RepID=UPI0023FA2BD5|nr:serine/threonine-protein phosphatase [Bifidobacterium sp. ESL0790]WEV72722.1 serine/threonine-protein phosphatase [Bifidobacterium sp. ESL0790]
MKVSRIHTAIGSDIGNKRRNNQDNGLAALGVYVVCDGMGGGVGGERASGLAVKHLAALASKPARDRADIEATLQAAQDDTLELGDELGGVAGTTATGLVSPRIPSDDAEADGRLDPALWYVINVGDSRTYHLDRRPDGISVADSICQVTTDHSQRQEAIDSGLMLPEVANATIPRNIITQCVGSPDGIDPDFFAVDPVGRFVVCSDGLHSLVEEHEIGEICEANPDPQDTVTALITAALDAGGDDNVTVIVVDIDADEAQAGQSAETANPAMGSPKEPWHASKLDRGEDLGTISDITLDGLRT